jgi:hypothetical protein
MSKEEKKVYEDGFKVKSVVEQDHIIASSQVKVEDPYTKDFS